MTLQRAHFLRALPHQPRERPSVPDREIGNLAIVPSHPYPSSLCTLIGENAGKHTAMYSAPSGPGVE